MSEWTTVPIGDVAEVFDGPHATPKKTVDGPWFLSISSLSGGRLNLGESAHLSRDDFVKWTRRVAPQTGDVLFSYETRLGEAAAMPAGLEACLGRRMGLLRPRSEKADSRFLLYAYLSPRFQQVIKERSIHGATVDRIPLTELPNWPIAVPSLREQRAIGAALGALDDKIALNERLSQTAMALALTEGKRLLSASSGEEVALAENAEIVKGVSYRSADLGGGENALVTLKCVGRDGTFQNAGLKPYSGVHKNSQVVYKGDIVVAQTDLTQRADVIGRAVRVVPLNSSGCLVASLDLVIVRPGPTLSRETLFALLSTQHFRDHALSYCNGTTVMHMGARALPEYRFRMPSGEAVKAATDVMAPLFDKSDGVKREIQTLAQLRDALLPGLMSGAIRVRDAEKLVEDAT